MKNRVAFLFPLLFLLCSGWVISQDQAVFAPFVSRLQAVLEKDTIKLTWKNTDDIKGKIFIYRHTEEITAGNFPQSMKIGEVESGVESYSDKPLDTRSYYYAVLIQGQGEKLYNLFIPFRNKTTLAVGRDRIITEEDLAVRITKISTALQNDFITLTFTSSAAEREISIYRNTAPIRSTADLMQSASLKTMSSSKTSMQDYAIPGINYYYAVLDTTMVKLGKISLKPGDNTTILPAQIPAGSRIGLPGSNSSRPLPLPLFPLSYNLSTGTSLGSPYASLPVERQMDNKTREALYQIYRINPEEKTEEPAPYVFPEDRPDKPASGEAYALQSLLQDSFEKQDWAKAGKDLENFLSLHRSRDIELRAHYYLGQVYFKQRNYEKSFMEFLLVEDVFYVESVKWIDNIFRRLKS